MKAGIATRQEACTLGNKPTPSDPKKCVLLSEIGTYGCRLVADPSVDYVSYQAVKYSDLERMLGSFTFSFDMNGHGTAIPSQTVTENEHATEPTAPTASGYRFNGWFKDDGTFQQPWIFDIDKVTANTEVHAQWGVGQYTLRVNALPSSEYGYVTGGGIYEAGTSVSIQAFPNEGYAFLQWKEGESKTNPRTVTVNNDSEYNALFYRVPTGSPLRLVDTNKFLYTYDEWASIPSASKPTAIGVAVFDQPLASWLVFYKTNVPNGGQSVLGDSNNLPNPPFVPGKASEFLYPHSGKASSDIYLNKWPNSPTYAANRAAALTDGGLSWYVPNLYEITQLFSIANESEAGAHDGFNSYFSLASGCTTLTVCADGSGHAYWTSDIGWGGGHGTSGKIEPFRVYFRDNSWFQYWSSGNYVYTTDPNYFRPCARIPIHSVHATFSRGGGTDIIQGNPPSYISVSSGESFMLPSSGMVHQSLSFLGWQRPQGAITPGITGNILLPGTYVHITSNSEFVAVWGE